MDINLDGIAMELYGKLQTRFPNVEIGDENGEVLSKKEDVPNARFFEFPYKSDGVTLGTITITLDQDDGVILQIGGDLVDSDTPGIFEWIKTMGAFANKKLLNFKIVNLEKSNLDKRDYDFQAKRKKESQPMEPMMESKMYGTSKISYQDLGEARIVIKHTQPVNTEIAAGRTMHVERIYVENAMGERFAYPFKHLNGARALAEHLKHGGNPYDSIGKHITGLSEELTQLRKFKGHVGRNEALSEAMGDITTKVLERIEQVKKEVQHLQRKSYYETFAESFQDPEEQLIPEAVMDDWIDRLTVRTFNEELKSSFPFIFKLVSESDIPVKELSPEDMLSELSKDTLKSYVKHASSNSHDNSISNLATRAERKLGNARTHGDEDDGTADNNKSYDRSKKIARAVDHMTKEELAFEDFINGITENENSQNGTDTLTSPNKAVQNAAVQKLNQILASDLRGGPGGINAIESLKGIIDDPEFLNTLKGVDPELDTRSLIQQWVLEHAPEVAPHIEFGNEMTGGEEPAPLPEPLAPSPEAELPPEVPVAPQVPVAESMGNAKLKAKFIRAIECGATLETKMDFGNREMTLHDAIKECGMSPEDIGIETEEAESGTSQILKSIAGFWNKEARNFTIGGTRAKIEVVKGFKDGKFPNATPDDVKSVLRRIEQIDPSSSEHKTIMKSAGLDHSPEHDVDDHRPAAMMIKVGEMSTMESTGVTFSNDDSLARIIKLSR